MLSQAELETEGSGLAQSLVCLPPLDVTLSQELESYKADGVTSQFMMLRPVHSEKIVSKTLRGGWVFLSGIQFTAHFIDFFCVETKRFVGSFVHVILTQQTCGQRSSTAVESKHQALGNYFLERIWYMFPVSKCRGD